MTFDPKMRKGKVGLKALLFRKGQTYKKIVQNATKIPGK